MQDARLKKQAEEMEESRLFKRRDAERRAVTRRHNRDMLGESRSDCSDNLRRFNKPTRKVEEETFQMKFHTTERTRKIVHRKFLQEFGALALPEQIDFPRFCGVLSDFDFLRTPDSLTDYMRAQQEALVKAAFNRQGPQLIHTSDKNEELLIRTEKLKTFLMILLNAQDRQRVPEPRSNPAMCQIDFEDSQIVTATD